MDTSANSEVMEQVITNANLHLFSNNQCSSRRQRGVTEYYSYESNNILTLAFNIISGDAAPLILQYEGPVSMQMSRAQALSDALAPSMVRCGDLSQPEE